MGLLLPLPWLTSARAGASGAKRQANASTATCSLGSLAVTVAGGSAASNQEALLLRFRNTGRTACSLFGFPKVAAVRPGANATAKDRLSIYNGGWTGNVPPRVLLRRGQSASAVIGGAGVPAEGVSTACYHQPFKSFRVSIAAEKGSLRFSALLPKEGLYLPSCAGVWVTLFAPGVAWFLPGSS
jgi:hypothetical protein